MVKQLVKRVRRYLRPLKRWSIWTWETFVVLPKTRRRYRWVRQQIRRSCFAKIRVVFLLNELPKWKMQHVLELMLKDPRFEPIVALTLADVDWKQDTEVLERKHSVLNEYFRRHGVEVVELADIQSRTVMSPRGLCPQVVFYQQPWDYAKVQHPVAVAKYALTCYVPYYVPNTESLGFDCDALFQRTVMRYYVLNDAWKRAYDKYVPQWRRAGDFVMVGHPMLDLYGKERVASRNGKVVVYAPHWSISYPGFLNSEHYSTFLDNGREILAYAQRHPELRWVFKPHPNLRHALVESGAWTRDEVEDYYAAWARIGDVCLTSEYVELFRTSFVMLTDCGSFLIEYMATGRPLVRMISASCRMKIPEWNHALFDSFYNCSSNDDLFKTLDRILVNEKDDKRLRRVEQARKHGLMDSHSSELIIDDMVKLVMRSEFT